MIYYYICSRAVTSLCKVTINNVISHILLANLLSNVHSSGHRNFRVENIAQLVECLCSMLKPRVPFLALGIVTYVQCARTGEVEV